MRASGEDNIILFNKFNNSEMNLHEFNILFIIMITTITYSLKELLIVKKIIFHQHSYYIMLMLSTLLTLCLYSANNITSKYYYTSVISFLLNGFITLLHHVLCDQPISESVENCKLMNCIVLNMLRIT